jgi:hypothetical protein
LTAGVSLFYNGKSFLPLKAKDTRTAREQASVCYTRKADAKIRFASLHFYFDERAGMSGPR